MNKEIKNLLQEILAPILSDYGFTKGAGVSYTRTADNILLLLKAEAARFNPPGSYGFHIIIDLVGLKPSVPIQGDLVKMIKAGHQPILALDIREILKQPVLPFEYKEGKEASLRLELQNIFNQDRVCEWITIKSLGDLEAFLNQPYGERLAYGLAVFLAMNGNKEKSREYFMRVRNNATAMQVAASLGIQL